MSILFGKRRLFALISFALFFPFAHGSATTIQYTVYSTWAANVTSPIELNFASLTNNANYSTSAGKTMNPATGTQTQLPFVVTGPYTGGYQLTTAWYTSHNIVSFYGPASSTGNITVTLPTGGENAFLLGIGSVSASIITVTLSDGETFSVAGAANTTEFLGLSISHDVNWVTVASPGQAIVNDFYFGGSKLTQDGGTGNPPAAVEGSTLCLLGGGLLSMVGLRRKLFPAQLAA